MQEYTPGQGKWKDPQARGMDYYLNARKIVEDNYLPTGHKPNVWENYRGLFFTECGGEKIDGPLI
jgi:hypothetical protein